MPDRRASRPLLLSILMIFGLTGCPWPWGSPPAHAPAPLKGQVLLDGKPASGVRVKATFTNATPFTNPTPFSVAEAVTTEVTTNDQGQFSFPNPPEGELNLEAVKDDQFKAIRLGVAVRSNAQTDIGRLELKRTGHLIGRVTAPEAPQVSEFIGTDVFIPGTSYVAKTDQNGTFRILNVAAGSFRLMADNRYLGRGEIPQVTVESGKEVAVPDLVLSLKVPSIDRLDRVSGAAGSWVRIEGQNFGASEGIPVEVKFNGIEALEVVRESNTAIRAKVPLLASSGPVVVKVGLVPSISPVTFQVIKRLELGTPTPLILRIGDTLQFEVDAFDAEDANVPDPVVEWSCSASGVGVLSPSGLFTAQAHGQTFVTATSGDMAVTSASPLYVSPLYEGMRGLQSGSAVGGSRMASGGGAVLVAWSTYHTSPSTHYRLSGQLLKSDGTWTHVDLSGLGQFAHHPHPAVSWNGQRFEIGYAAAGSLKVQAIDPSTGTPAGGSHTLVTLSEGIRELDLHHGGSSWLLSWIDSQNRIYATSDVASGTSVLVAEAGAALRGALSSAYDGNRFWLGWQEDQTIRTSRWQLPTPTPASPISGGQNQSHPTLVGSNGGVIAVWQEARNGETDLMVARSLGDGWGAPNPMTKEGSQGQPRLMVQGSALWMSWQEPGGVFIRKLSDQGVPLSDPYAVVVGGTPFEHPAIAASGTGGVVSWGVSGNNGLLSLFAQRFQP